MHLIAERRFKAVVLISDGEDHDPEAVKTAEDLAEQGMMINTVGIGSPDGSYIPRSGNGRIKNDATGNTVISKLNEDVLKQIAANTNGIYIRLQESDEAVAVIKQQLSQIESKAYGDISLMNFKAYYWWFAGAMLLLLLAENFIPETKKKKRMKILLSILSIVVGLPCLSQDVNKTIQKGNKLYQQQNIPGGSRI